MDNDMAIVKAFSDIASAQLLGKPNTRDMIGDGTRVLFRYTADIVADPGSKIMLYTTQVGISRLIVPSCVLRISGFAAGSTIDIGIESYTTPQQEAVSAQPDLIASGIAVEPDGIYRFDDALAMTKPMHQLFTQQIMISLTLTAGQLSVGGSIEGLLAFNRG